MNYSVIVGSIGTVYDGPSLRQANAKYKEYVSQSKDGYGRAGHEEVTMMEQKEEGAEPRIKREFQPQIMTPTIAELTSLIVSLKKEIGDEYRASDDPDDDTPGMAITIGCGYNGWSYQTGDNSYTGAAYGYPLWGVGSIYRNTNSRQLARELIEDALNQAY